MMPDLTGQQFGNYRLVRLLGTGGFASVYLGQHVRIASQQAAIKILHLFGVDAQAFQQEAETTASLDHPHIVRLLDFDLHQGTMPFLIMGYAAQGSLRNRHPKGTPLPLSTIIQYTKEIASALQYAHDNNIIHRDIKPENILIGRRDELLLSDFGISVLSKTGRTSLEHGYNIGGTAEYMAPEMFRGKPEKASDQYALGVVVYEWLSGTPPFTEGNPIQLGFQHTHEEVPPLRKKLPSLSSRLDAVIMRALAKDTNARFPSIQAFANALEEATQTAPPQAIPPKVLQPARPMPPIGTRLLTYQGHTDAVYAVAWSPDGTRLASGSDDKTVQIWDANSRQVLLNRIYHTDFVIAVVWSPDGTRLASGSGDKTVQIWDANSGRQFCTYTGHS
ncbi:MAG: serine/threonine-protein kinase, partial [Ktedonobacteraceae bacterium]